MGSATAKPRQVSVLLHPLVGWFCPAALARLEPESTSARLYAARATPTPRGEPAASRRRFATHRGCDPFPRAARALAPLVGRAAGSQCARSNSWASDDQSCSASQKALPPRSVWRRLNIRLDSRWLPSSRTSLLLRVEPHGLFSWLVLTSSSLLPCFALHPADSAISHGLNSGF